MFRRVKFLRREISYDCVVIEGYQTKTKTSYGKLSFHYATIGSWLRICLFESIQKDCAVLTWNQVFRGVAKATLTKWYQINCECVMVKF